MSQKLTRTCVLNFLWKLRIFFQPFHWFLKSKKRWEKATECSRWRTWTGNSLDKFRKVSWLFCSRKCNGTLVLCNPLPFISNKKKSFKVRVWKRNYLLSRKTNKIKRNQPLNNLLKNWLLRINHFQQSNRKQSEFNLKLQPPEHSDQTWDKTFQIIDLHHRILKTILITK